MPQLDVPPFASQIFWLIVAFSTLYYLLSRKALPRLGEILEARQDRIAADLDEAQRLRRDAEAALASYERLIAEAQDEAHALLAETQARLQARRPSARRSSTRGWPSSWPRPRRASPPPRTSALTELEEAAVGAAQAAAERLAGLKVPKRTRAGGAARGPRGGRLMLELWLLIALIILIAVIYKPLTRIDLRRARRPRRQGARRARRRPSACARRRRACSPTHQRQLVSGEDRARAIVEHAKAETERQIERHRAELEASMRRRTEHALARIAQEEARALQDVRNRAATLAIRTTERLLREQVDGAAGAGPARRRDRGGRPQAVLSRRRARRDQALPVPAGLRPQRQPVHPQARDLAQARRPALPGGRDPQPGPGPQGQAAVHRGRRRQLHRRQQPDHRASEPEPRHRPRRRPRCRASAPQALALQRLLEDHLYFVWCGAAGSTPRAGRASARRCSAGIPPPLRQLVAVVVRRRIRSSLYAQGLGRHQPGRALRDGPRPISRRSPSLLGERPFFVAERPTTIDAVAYGCSPTCCWSRSRPSSSAARGLCQPRRLLRPHDRAPGRDLTRSRGPVSPSRSIFMVSNYGRRRCSTSTPARPARRSRPRSRTRPGSRGRARRSAAACGGSRRACARA